MGRKELRLVCPFVVKAERAQCCHLEFSDIVHRLVDEQRASESKIADEVDPKCAGIRE